METSGYREIKYKKNPLFLAIIVITILLFFFFSFVLPMLSDGIAPRDQVDFNILCGFMAFGICIAILLAIKKKYWAVIQDDEIVIGKYLYKRDQFTKVVNNKYSLILIYGTRKIKILKTLLNNDDLFDLLNYFKNTGIVDDYFK